MIGTFLWFFFFSKGNQVACLVTHIWCSFDGWSQFLVVFLGDDDSSFLEREFFSVFQEHVDLTPKVRYLPCVQIWKKTDTGLNPWDYNCVHLPNEHACIFFFFCVCVYAFKRTIFVLRRPFQCFQTFKVDYHIGNLRMINES